MLISYLACDLLENGVAAIFGPSSKTTSGKCLFLSKIQYY